MFDETFVQTFPGFLSVRNAVHEIVYLNKNFKDWIQSHTDVDPLGMTNHEIARTCEINVASVFAQCHDASLCWQKNSSSNASLKRTIAFEDKSGNKENTQYFDLLKYGLVVDGESYIFTVGYDVTSMYTELLNADKKHTKELERIAYYDELTNIPNVSRLKVDVARILSENSNQKFMVLKFDIRQFKMINERAGFEAGDRILQVIAATTVSILNSRYSVFAREGGDKFILFDCYNTIEEIDNLRLTLIAAFRHSISQFVRMKIDFPFARYLIPANEKDVATILEKVNIAHRESKEYYSDRFLDYNEDLKKHILAEADMEGRMAPALAQNEFALFLQPKVRIDTEQIVGAEALVRWQAQGAGMLYPNQFIPLFEKNGFVTSIDMFMLDSACEIIKGWIKAGKSPVPVSINFSRLHLNNDDFVSELVAVVKKHGISTKYIEIELTETTVFDNEKLLQTVLSKLHECGFTVSMDDFGSGYSSLGLLKNLPVDVIKIDRSFLVENDDAERSNIVIGSVISMAQKLGIQTVAEGVETREQVELLKQLGCELVQGYFYAKPMPHANFTKGYLTQA